MVFEHVASIPDSSWVAEAKEYRKTHKIARRRRNEKMLLLLFSPSSAAAGKEFLRSSRLREVCGALEEGLQDPRVHGRFVSQRRG